MSKHLLPSLILGVSILAGLISLAQAIKQPPHGDYMIISAGATPAAYKLNTRTGDVYWIMPKGDYSKGSQVKIPMKSEK